MQLIKLTNLKLIIAIIKFKLKFDKLKKWFIKSIIKKYNLSINIIILNYKFIIINYKFWKLTLKFLKCIIIIEWL